MESLHVQGGALRTLRDVVVSDPSLCPEIRNDILTIYYRGGLLLQIKRLRNGRFQSCLTDKYLNPGNGRNWFGINVEEFWDLNVTDEVIKNRIQSIPFLKVLMDEYFDRKRIMREKEFQQQIVIANNRCDRANTDYFFCDMEFANQGQRFDLVGVLWPKRRNNKLLQLSVGEVKFGKGAIRDGNGDAGLVGHFNRFINFIHNPGQFRDFKNEVLERFNQKQELGFIPAAPKQIKSFADGHPDYLVILGDCNPNSAILRQELKAINNLYVRARDKRAGDKGQYTGRVLVAHSHFFGLGLWERGMVDLCEFAKMLNDKNYPE